MIPCRTGGLSRLSKLIIAASPALQLKLLELDGGPAKLKIKAHVRLRIIVGDIPWPTPPLYVLFQIRVVCV